MTHESRRASSTSGEGEVHPEDLGGGERVAAPGQAAAVLFLVALLFFAGSVAFSLLLGMEGGLLVAQWVALLGPILLFVRARGLDFRRVFYLRRPSGRELAAGLLVVLGGMPLALFLAWIQGFVLEVPTEVLEQLQELVAADTVGRLLWLLLLLAVTPAICEEFVFRGFLLSSTERRFAVLPLLLLNGVVFGIFHLTPFRVLPTAFLGVLLALVVWRTRSIWVGVLMHMINNGLIVILSSAPVLPALEGAMEERPPIAVLPVALVMLGIGLYLLFASERRPGAANTLDGVNGGG